MKIIKDTKSRVSAWAFPGEITKSLQTFGSATVFASEIAARSTFPKSTPVRITIVIHRPRLSVSAAARRRAKRAQDLKTWRSKMKKLRRDPHAVR